VKPDAAPRQDVRQVLGAVHAVVIDHGGGGEGQVQRGQFLGVPDHDGQTGALEGGQGQLARRVGQQDDQERIRAFGFEAGHGGLEVFATEHGAWELHVGERPERGRRSRRNHASRDARSPGARVS